MIDDDDVGWVALLWPTPQSWLGWAVFLAVILTMCAVASSNSKDCSEKHCATGTPKVIDGECLCVEKPR